MRRPFAGPLRLFDSEDVVWVWESLEVIESTEYNEATRAP